jgi:hypothetical protein
MTPVNEVRTENANATRVDNEIVIRFDGKTVNPSPPLQGMNPGETVRYSSPDGKVRIEFKDNGSPFRETVIEDRQIVKVQNVPGKFRCRCFVTLPGGKTVGWDEKNPDLSGADHDVPRK